MKSNINASGEKQLRFSDLSINEVKNQLVRSKNYVQILLISPYSLFDVLTHLIVMINQ